MGVICEGVICEVCGGVIYEGVHGEGAFCE